MFTGSPVLNEKTFEKPLVSDQTDVMTLNGTIGKSALLAGMCFASAVFLPRLLGGLLMPVVIFGFLATIGIAIALYFKPNWSPVLAPGYAVLEGIVLGAISALYAAKFGGIVTQAVLLTFGVLAGMLALYSFRIIRATEKFRAIVMTATAGIAIFYLVAMGLGMFGVKIPFLHQGGWLGIGFSLLVVGLAALNLIIDFDNIEQGVAARAPKYMEWYCGFALLLTLVWLYLELLRLLAKLRSND